MNRQFDSVIASLTTEVKHARSDRRHLIEAAARRQHQWRLRQFNRAIRRQGKALCREARS
jgi:hypothetical protein